MRNNLCVVALALAGCGVGEIEDVSVHAQAQAQAQDPDPHCDPLTCPGNSDLLAALGPYELDETGLEYSMRGFRITGMTYGQQPAADLEIDGTLLKATAGGLPKQGHDLVGLRLTLHHQPTDRMFRLWIVGYTRVPYYVGPGELWGYDIRYTDVETEEVVPAKPLCPYGHVDHGIAGTWAVFWKGDRYDPETGRIHASNVGANSGVGPWFNISCAGEATIKMLRARTGGAVDVDSPVRQRQATLNMFTASYCGPTGRRYTELGQPLDWSDTSGPQQMGAVVSDEAIWSASGAVCLDVPRMVRREQVDCGAEIPHCTKSMKTSWKRYGWLRSGNPPAP